MTSNINGIDVSECEYINCCSKEAKCIILQDDICSNSQYCKSEPDCYFKQFKRLEQREKALTEKADDLQKRNHDLTLTNERLEQENKELKKRQITKNGFICDCEQNAKYRQALEEIKKWATNHNPCDIDPEVKCTKEDCFNCLNYDIKKIIKIIDEVLNDRD